MIEKRTSERSACVLDTKDYLSEQDLLDLGIETWRLAELLHCATELLGLDGTRCWASEEIKTLQEGLT